MRCQHLAVQPLYPLERKIIDQKQESELRSIRDKVEHTLAAKAPVHPDPVDAPDQSSRFIPRLKAMGIAETMQFCVSSLHLCGDPGSVLTGARSAAAGSNHGFEGLIHRESEGCVSPYPPETAGDMQAIEIQNRPVRRAEPEQRIPGHWPGEDALRVGISQQLWGKWAADADDIGLSGVARRNKIGHGYNFHMIPPTVPVPSRSALTTLLLTSALTAALWFVPLASLALYPLRLFVTFIHEGSHALAAIMTGGAAEKIVVLPDASGYTLTGGGWGIVIVMAGYLGAAAYGAGLLALARRPNSARFILRLSGVIVALLDLFLVRNGFGFGWGVVIAAGLILAALRLPARIAELTAMFLGVQCVVNALFDLKTLLGLSSGYGGPVSDAVLMSQMIPLPPFVWAALWSALSLLILGAALRPYWRQARPISSR